MLPVTVPASHGDAAHPDSGRVVPTTALALLALDEQLFNPSPSAWLVIDAGNSAVPRVAVPSLDAGLELIGKGRIAALVGHLRDGAGVVDVDVRGAAGNFLAGEVAVWLRRRGCWVLERPSGGAKGRWHVFFARHDYVYAAADQRTGLAAELSTYLVGLAADLKVRVHDLDLRNAVRPLSSPHRHGATTRPKGDLRGALRSLRHVFRHRPEPAPLRRRAKIKPTAPSRTAADETTAGTGARVVPLVLQRWKRELRPDWRQYLLKGQTPAGPWNASVTMTRAAVETDRSLVESACTRELVWAIGDPTTAWQIIRESHPTAMTKAKHQGYSWWIRYVWNELVRSAGRLDIAIDRPRQVDPPPAEILAAVAAARSTLTVLMWTVSARQRPALLLVGHHLLDRVLRERNLRVPCPERDLLLDTSLGDRKTIRSALARLNGHIGTLHTDCLSVTERDSTSYEFEINPAPKGGGRQFPPPVLDPPPRPRGLWGALPRTSHSLWRTLLTSDTPLELGELAVKAGLVEEARDEPSKSQRTTTKAALAALSRAGMARVDEEGRWRVTSRPRSAEIDQAAALAYARRLVMIAAERAAYRAAITSTWSAGRARAIKVQKAKEKGWWDNLSPAARADRSNRKRLEFNQMSLSQQAALKARLAEGRIRAGLPELETYQAWLRGISADEYGARTLERKAIFQSLSPAGRGASIAAWDNHRRRYGLQTQRLASPVEPARSGAGEQRAVLPNGETVRNAAFLERQGTLFQATDHLAAG